MRRSLCLSLLGALALVACQATSQPQLQPASLNPALRQQSATGALLPSLKLPLSPALLQEIQQPDSEPEPRDQSYNESLVNKILAPHYVHAHSYYFDHLDSAGRSTVEVILSHDGHQQAADWVKHWRKTLSEGSEWPDRNSTTYNGRFTALEHGQVSRTKGWFMFRNASGKAQEYYQLALKAWHPDLPPTHRAQTEAWAWLGRTSHFLQDMTVPFHTKSMVRPAQALYHHGYEVTSEERFDEYMPARNNNPHGVWLNGGPYPATGSWGLYYPPNTSAEAMIIQMADQSEKFYKLVNRLQNNREGNWEKSRAVMIPTGAKLTSGLVMAYLQEVGALRR